MPSQTGVGTDVPVVALIAGKAGSSQGTQDVKIGEHKTSASDD